MTICVVVLDRRVDKNASTGLFELAYRQAPVPVPAYVGVSLIVEGQFIKKPSGECRKTTNDAAGSHGSREGNCSQHKVRCANGVEEPGLIAQKVKSVEIGTISTHRTALNRTQQTKPANGSGNWVPCEGRTRQKLTDAVATDSALNAAAHEKPNAAERVRVRRTDQQKCTTSLVRRQRASRVSGVCSADSSDSDCRPQRPWTATKNTKTASVKSSVWGPTSKVERRRSTVRVGESTTQMPTTTTTGGRRRKSTRPGAARPRRHQRVKPPPRRRHAASDADSESAHSDHVRGPSTPPPTDASLTVAGHGAASTSMEPAPGGTPRLSTASRHATSKPAGSITCGVTLTLPGRQTRRRRTPSFHDVTSSNLMSTSTIRFSPSVIVQSNAGVTTPCEQSHTGGGPPTPLTDAFRSLALPPNAPSFPARQICASRQTVVPVDRWLRHSHDSLGGLHLSSSASRSMVMSARDLAALQASMQVIGLGNTA